MWDAQTQELASASDRRASLISVDPERHSGTPCFAGTRVPIQDLFDYMEEGESLDPFILSFPTVSREHAIRLLQFAEDRLREGLPAQVSHVEKEATSGEA